MDRFSYFCTAHGKSRYTLQWASLSPKIATSDVGSAPPSNTCFLRLARVLNPNGISISSAVFAGLTLVQCDGRTDRPRYSVGNVLRCGLIISSQSNLT